MTITREINGTEYQFSSDGFTVHIQESEGSNFQVVRGIVAISVQHAIEQASEILAISEPNRVNVYRGADGWYAANECIYSA